MQRSWGNSPSMMVCDGSVGWRRRSWRRRPLRLGGPPLSKRRGSVPRPRNLSGGIVVLRSHRLETSMDKDRIKGSAQQAKGKVKEVAGKATGDKKLEGEGKADKIGGKIRNAVSGMKDALRGR